ncbi:hypothetical protein QZH41_017617, partial [Actinostola sp. cb2023]
NVRFQFGKEYSYNYVGETITSVNGSSAAQSALKIKARCFIKTIGACQHVLKIDSVELWESQGKNLPLEFRLSRETAAFARELQTHDLIFRSRNGAIIEVLPAKGESSKILNIKKGILSALQVQFVNIKHSTLSETDVAGKCPAHYHVRSKHLNGRVKVISKTRNLKDCTERTKTDPLLSLLSLRSLNLLMSSSNCRYILTAKRHVQKVVCHEKHLFRPFSSGVSAGASTVTKQVLTLQNARRVSPDSDIEIEGRPTLPLLYQHNTPEPDNLESQKVIDLIQMMSRLSMEETKPESARLFSKLVFSLRKLDNRAATKVWDSVFECDKSAVCKPEEKERFQMYLLDALPHCGTSGCARVISHAIKHDLVNGERGNMFLAGIALVSTPTQDMIGHVLDLCMAKPSRTAMLTLGTLIHKLCENDMNQEAPFMMLRKWLVGMLGVSCSFETPDKADNIIMALKAIGNAGRPSNAQPTMLKCAMDENVPKNLSISALEALRRMPCSPDITEQLLSIYGNHYFDIEIRIASYLALLKCPSVELFKRIAKIQKEEMNQQVGSFVWSHITNAMESTEPVYGRPMADMISKALDGKVLREFNLNRLRFSRAWEASYYNELLGAGGSMQGHLIYHPNSFFPRSTQVNVTVDVLGASINVLEAAARFEGFEILLEQFFGTDGYYPDKRIMEMFNLVPHEERDNTEKEINGLPIRGRRSINDDIDRVEKHLEKLDRKMDKVKHSPSGTVSVKLFGNEIRVASFDDISWLQSEADNINMVDLLIKLSRGGKKTYTKSMIFLDVETTVPTMLGLPLKLDAKGTSVVTVEMSGKLDVRNMFWGPMAFDIRGHLKPSAVIEVAGRMTVDAIFVEAGVLVNASMYTSTEIKGNATYKQGQVLKFEIGAPTKPVQIFNVSSSLFATLNGNEVKIQGTERRIEPAPCFNFTRVLGIAVCGRISLPMGFRDLKAPFFPLSGPASFSLSVLPTDPKLRLYQIVAQRLPSEDESNYDIVARISTPKATWEREFEANVSLWLTEKQKSFSVSTGALGYKFGNLSASYHNVTNAINVTFDARDVLYGNRIVLNGQYFNKTNPETRERQIGTKWSASYKNYTITQLTQVYNKSRTYGILSNTTYWPGKYIFANAELSIPTKSLSIIANHTCTKTTLRFKGQLAEEENTFLFNVSSSLKKFSVEMKGAMNKIEKEATLNTYILPCKQSFTVKSSYVSQKIEKGIHFRASHDNKKRVFAWYTGIINQTNEKSVKTNATILGKPFQAIWTFFNYTSEKGFKFNSTAMGKSVNSAISMIVKDGLKSIKFNASALNKTAEAVWSYVNSGVRKSLHFNANIVNKKLNADLTFQNLTNIKSLIFNANIINKKLKADLAFHKLANVKSLIFNASGFNKTIAAAWTFMNFTNDKILQFNASALNKNIEAFWMYSKADTTKSIKFNASAFNKTIKSALSFFNLPQEKSIKLNATALNKQFEAIWTFFTLPTEKGLKFSAKGLNKSATSVVSFVNMPSTKALKFNATVLNKTIDAAWTYLDNQYEKTLKFNANAINKTVEALWTYFNFKSEKGLRFKAKAVNKNIEGVWSYFTSPSEKGLKFNATIQKKTVNASMSYFKLRDSMGVKFSASALNKSLGLFTKMMKEGDDRTVTIGGAYQNYSVAVVAALKNLTLHKSLCVHSEFLGRRYGKICATFSNSSLDRSIALNIRILNRQQNKYNDAIYMETWLNFQHSQNLRALGINMTIVNKTVGAELFMERKPEDSKRTIGVNMIVLKKTMGMKTVFVNHRSLKEASVHIIWNKAQVASSRLMYHNLTNEKILEVRYRVGYYAAVMKAEYRLRENGAQRELELVNFIRNGTKMMFYDSSLLIYKHKDRRRDLNFIFSLSTLGRYFKYGWDLSHTNRSTESTLEHELKAALMYSNNKKVSVTSSIKNDKERSSTYLTVEYLPGKTVRHSIVWYKEGKNIVTTIELLPRIPFVNSLEWNTNDGLFLRSTTTLFKRNTESYFRFSKRSESYDGKIEFWPGKSMSFHGQFSRKNGLLITSTIEALTKKWSHKLDINKQERKFFISIDFIPQKPTTFEASWDLVKGLKIKTKMSALKKSLQLDAFFRKLAETWKSDITILKEKVLFFGNFDKNTKTLNASVQIRNRRIGFVGRFDLKAYVASAHLSCNDHMTGWSLKLNRDARNIIFNATLTSRMSGQVVAEMPNNRQLQMTLQRKLGENIVNESRVIYKLSPEASRIFLTWNTTTVNYIASKINSLKPIIMKETMKLYNLTLKGAKNMTSEIEVLVKKMERKLKPQVMKLYQAVKSYDYNGVYNNFSILAKSISVKAVKFTSQAYNISMKALKKTIKDLPMLARNASELYKKIRAEIIKIRSIQLPKITKQVLEQFEKVKEQLEKVKEHLKNVGVHLKSISRDLQSWGNNVTMMVGEIQIRNVKISSFVKRVAKVVAELQQKLTKNVTFHAKKLLRKIRAIEIRKLKIGEMVDKFMLNAREFSCDFDAKCTWKNISRIAIDVSHKIKKVSVLNKTLEQHFRILKEKTIKATIDATILSRKLVKMAPTFLRNTTIKSIQMVRILSMEVKNVSMILVEKVRVAVSKASLNVQKYTKPLTKLLVKVSVSIYNRAKPQVVMYFERVQPSMKYLEGLYNDALAFNKPIFLPMAPFSKDIIHQLFNITITKIPVGAALEKSIKMTVEEIGKFIKEYNHTITNNVTTILKFINDLSKHTPEEIIDITILKVFKLVNDTKELVNKTVEYTFTSSKKALAAYKESMSAMDLKIKKILQMRPEDVVELSIQNIHLSIKNMTALVKNMSMEVQSIAKQLQNLDFEAPFMMMWKEADLIHRYSSLALGEKWNKIVEKYIKMFKSLNLKERAMAIKTQYEQRGERIMKEFTEISTFGEKAYKLVMKLMRMQINREAFVKELLSIIEGSKLLAKKHFHIAKDATFALYTVHNKYWDTAAKSLSAYKDVSLNKVQKSYKNIEKYIVEFGKEHEEDFKEAYGFYKDIALDIYKVGEQEAQIVKRQALKKLDELKIKLVVQLESLVLKLRKYENITYEEMGVKIYQVSKKYGLQLYKKYNIKAIAFYNNTKKLTLRAYNLSRVMAIKYYKIGKIHAIRIFKDTKNFTVTYYKISRSMTIKAFHDSRRMSLKLFNISRNLTIRGIEYLNKTVKPKMIVLYGKGKVYVINLYKESKAVSNKALEDVKIWYGDNKEKTVEELYQEAYGAVNVRVNKLVEKVKAKVQIIKAKVQKIKAKIQAQVVLVNRTIRSVSLEVLSVYKQSKNVFIISGKQLVAIFAPYAKTAQNKTMVVFLQLKKKAQGMDFQMVFKAKNMTVLYFNKAKSLVILSFNKAKSLVILNLNKAKNCSIELYRNITTHKEFKNFMAKHQIKERYNKMITKAKEIIEKVKAFMNESKPKLEAKYREALHYLNVTLRGMIKAKKEEIMANPREYAKSIYMKTKNRVIEMIKDTFKDTAVEEILLHEIWSDYLEEIKQHEFATMSKEIAQIGKEKADAVIKKLMEKINILKIKAEELKLKLKTKVEEIKQKTKKMYKDTKAAVVKGFNDFKQMKLKEFVEHRYIFKTIEFAKNTSLKIQNMKLQAKDITLKWIAVGKVFYKNMTIKARHYKQVVEKYVIALKKNCTIVCEKVKVIAKKYILIAKKYIIIAKNYTKNYTTVAKTMTIKAWRIAPKVIPYYKNKVLPFYNNKVLPMYYKYTKLAIETSKNMTKLAYKRTINSAAYKFTLKSYDLTLDLLRNASKMTPRQTVLKIRQMSLVAYDFTLKTAHKAVNVSKIAYKEGVKKLYITKIQLSKFFKNNLKAATESMKPLIPVLNFTKNEIIETIVFIDKYYGIEDLLRERVSHHYRKFQVRYQKLHKTLQQHYGKMQKESDNFIKTIPGLMKASAYEALELVNKTIRFTHYSIGYINSTIISVRRAMPKIPKMPKMPELKNYIRFENGLIVIIIPHPKPVTGDLVSICNDACDKVKSIPRLTKKLSRQALVISKSYASKALNISQKWLNISQKWVEVAMATPVYQRVQNVTLRLISATKNHPLAKKYLNTTIQFLKVTRQYLRDLDLKEMALKVKNHPVVKRYMVSTVNYIHMTRKYLRELNFKKIANLTKSYAPIAYNMSKEMLKLCYSRTRNYTMKFTNAVWNITADIYNSTSSRHALMKAKHYTMKAFNETTKYYRTFLNNHKVKIEQIKIYVSTQKALTVAKARIAIRKARVISMQLLNMTKNHPIVKQYMNSTMHFINVSRNFIDKINFTKIAKMTKYYAPQAFNITKDMCRVGMRSAKIFTIQVAKMAWNISTDIYNSTCIREALMKARNHSTKAYIETAKLYRILYTKTMEKYARLNKTARALYETIYNHNLTQKCMHHARRYYGHSMRMLESRARHFNHIKKYWHHRIAHKLNHVKNVLNPIYWIPPFNSTAVIFGKSHVYSFDSQYFKFPGYNNEHCTYILARDVRDNKFTLMSQESALIFVAEDANVKIQSDGTVETMTKITYDGKKIHDGYDSELPVQTQNMTVAREGPYIVLRHTLGLEILCDVEHYLCTFNIGRWYHGRLAGLLGTNNNEYHDEMMRPSGKVAKNVLDFVNSWEVTKDPRCQIKKAIKPKHKCTVSKYVHRCRDLFKDLKSPFAPFFNIIKPKPFMQACEEDYRICDSYTPKDMKHCNVSATYVELLKMKGQWVDYLPECGRCSNHELGGKWFQSANNAVDIILVVPETQGMRGFAKKIPNYVRALQSDLSKYSIRFGLVSYGGKGIHSHPHEVTLNGKFLGSAEDVNFTINHLRFSDTQDNETDGFEGIAKASMYPFRAGATKIIVLWTTSERYAHADAPCLRRMTKKLHTRDITLNIIGKYQKYAGEVNGQDYLGRVFYRKMTQGSKIGASLPEGEFIELMKNTKGSAFGIAAFGSDNTRRSYALRESFVYTLKEQIKRDQVMCKECFCARGLVGEGRAICKINKHHKC